MDTMTRVGRVPTDCREKRRVEDLSLRQAARQIGISNNTLWRIEQGYDYTVSILIAVLNWLDGQS